MAFVSSAGGLGAAELKSVVEADDGHDITWGPAQQRKRTEWKKSLVLRNPAQCLASHVKADITKPQGSLGFPDSSI